MKLAGKTFLFIWVVKFIFNPLPCPLPVHRTARGGEGYSLGARDRWKLLFDCRGWVIPMGVLAAAASARRAVSTFRRHLPQAPNGAQVREARARHGDQQQIRASGAGTSTVLLQMSALCDCVLSPISAGAGLWLGGRGLRQRS